MIMTRKKSWKQEVAESGGLYQWVNSWMIRRMGPPQVGPYETQVPLPEERNVCPLCGKPMAAHDVDRSGERTFLHCPA